MKKQHVFGGLHQTGPVQKTYAKKIDQFIEAGKPGKRVVHHGGGMPDTIYYERRKNRSDVKKRV